MKHPLLRMLKKFHRDDRGNMAILILLTLWVLVVLLAMVWNSGESAARRQQAQNAADSAAQAAMTWTSRTNNQIAATNMLIVENACAEAVWGGYHDTKLWVEDRLNKEQRRLESLAQRVQQERAQNLGDAVIQLRCDLLEEAIKLAMQALQQEASQYTAWLTPVASALLTRDASTFFQEREDIRSYQHTIVGLTPECADAELAAVSDVTRCDLTYALPLSNAWPHRVSREIYAPIRTTRYTNIPPIHSNGTSVTQTYTDPRDGQQKRRDIHIRGGEWGRMDCPPFSRFYHERIARDLGDVAARGKLLKNVDDTRQELGEALQELLTPPPNIDPQLRRAYDQAHRRMNNLRLSQAFAFNQYVRSATFWRGAMLHRLGEEEQLVLATYHRYSIPEWAKPSIYQQVYERVYRDVIARNWDKPSPQREQGASRIALDIAQRWIDRAWPYEIRPPQDPVPPTQGLLQQDRLAHFTVLTGSLADQRSGAKPLLSKLFPSNDPPAAAYAQAETFNWMEFNAAYGAGDRYDHMYPPLAWRVSTIGGWNWRPRLALCDSLRSTLHNNPEFESFFNQSGIRWHDDSISNLVLH